MTDAWCVKCEAVVEAAAPGKTLCHSCFVELEQQEARCYGINLCNDSWAGNGYIARRFAHNMGWYGA